MAKLEMGKRYLIRAHVSDAAIHEAHPREFSPSGAHVRLGGYGWLKLDDIIVLEELTEQKAAKIEVPAELRPTGNTGGSPGPGTELTAAPVSLTPAMTGGGADGPVTLAAN